MNEVQRLAMEALSENYEGSDYEGEYNAYIGYNDAAIEFGPGIVSFVQENKNGIQFSIRINNSAAKE